MISVRYIFSCYHGNTIIPLPNSIVVCDDKWHDRKFSLDPTSVAQWKNEIEISDKAIEKLKKKVAEELKVS